MASKIVEVLEMLKDGKWHTLDEVGGRASLSRGQVQKIAGFLEEYEFVTVDDDGGMMRIEEAARRFLVREAVS